MAGKYSKHYLYYLQSSTKKLNIQENTQIWSIHSTTIIPYDDLSHRVMAEHFSKLGLADEDVISIADPRVKSLGFRVVVKSERSSGSLKLAELNANLMSKLAQNSYNTLRYKLGVSEGSSELVPGKALPLECNVDYLHGVSFHKGCYIGQELTARTHHTGIIRKRIMPLVFNSEDTENIGCELGESINNFGTGKGVGKIVSQTGNFGIGLMRVQECHDAEEKGQPIVVGNKSNMKVQVIKPDWWPKISPSRASEK